FFYAGKGLDRYLERLQNLHDSTNGGRLHGGNRHPNFMRILRRQNLRQMLTTSQHRHAVNTLAGFGWIVIDESDSFEIVIGAVAFYGANHGFSRAPRSVDENPFFSFQSSYSLIEPPA